MAMTINTSPSTSTILLLALSLVLGVAHVQVRTHAAFECKDLSRDCPMWKGNMGGNCRGEDYQYMLHHCPKTCDMCDEAREKWEKEEAERMKNPTYEPEDSSVVTLNYATIDDFVEEYKESHILMIEFYAPWCGHCQHVAPVYREAAAILEKESEAGRLPIPVKLAKFDDQARENAVYRAADESKWNFSSYPSMYLVHGDAYSKEYPEGKKDRYWGGNENAEEIVFHMTKLSEGKNQTEALIAYNDVEKRKKPGFYKEGGKHHTTEITELDPDNLEETMLRSDQIWIVEFYSDKCPICNSLAPDITKAATKAQEELGKDKIRYGACNSRVYREIAEAFDIGSYPWVASFYKGKKLEDMAGMGGWESFYNWGKSEFDKNYDGEPNPYPDATIPYKKEGEDGDDRDDAAKKDEL